MIFGSIQLQCQACDCAHEASDERLLYVSISQLAKRPHIARVTLGKWEKREVQYLYGGVDIDSGENGEISEKYSG